MRFIGAALAISSPSASRVERIIFEGNGPGAIAFTVIFGAKLLARCRVSWWTAALEAEYANVSIVGTWMPSIEPMLITRDGFSAVPLASSSGRKNFVT